MHRLDGVGFDMGYIFRPISAVIIGRRSLYSKLCICSKLSDFISCIRYIVVSTLEESAIQILAGDAEQRIRDTKSLTIYFTFLSSFLMQ